MRNLERLIRFRDNQKIIPKQNLDVSVNSTPKIINRQVDYAEVDRWAK